MPDHSEMTPWTEPYTVERLRSLIGPQMPEETRRHSTVLWAADEIERLRVAIAELLKTWDLNWPDSPEVASAVTQLRRSVNPDA